MLEWQSFEDANKANDKNQQRKSIPYDDYFGGMDISEDQKKKRKDSAEKLEDIFIGLLALVFYYMKSNVNDYAYATEQAQNQYRGIANNTNGLNVSDYYRDVHIPTTVMDVIGTTIRNPQNAFNFSIDRAMLIAENEANSMWGDSEFAEAVASGKTHKTWHSIVDRRTRDTHRYLDGKTIPITDPFEVGEYLMMFPKDTSMGAGMEEISNCRCSVDYSGESMHLSGAEFGSYNDENDPYNEKRDKIANDLYTQIRNRKREYEIDAVANNSGFTRDEIDRVYSHVFERKHLLSNGKVARFDPDYYMAHSWMRLREGKNIQEHDIVMLHHELEEEKIMGESLDIPYGIAHNIVAETYDYSSALYEYLKTHDV